MDTYQLPDFLHGGKDSDVYVHHYRSDKLYVKNKIVLNHNLICILLNGTKEVFGAQLSIKIDDSEILLMSAGNVIMWESIARDNKLESLLIFFSDSFLKDFCSKHHLNFSGKNKISRSVVNVLKDDYLYAFEQTLKISLKEKIDLIHRLKVEELLLYLSLRKDADNFYDFIRNSSGTVKRSKLKDVVEANMSRGLSVDELAFLCDMSVSTFKRHFEKTFKCSPQKYFTDKRMKKAKEMLMMEKRPSDIYSDLRYQNLSSFSTEFKKYFGVSPKQFQQSCR
jgi:AraC family transcriptional regulator, exoenzyme S synthesis regulatory protein ExsA